MDSHTQENNKRIAKNTVFLYIRMLLIMVVTLYTSRVVLATLGVEDMGIYNVVGGVVTMFAFLNGTISGATQRYLTYELGTGDIEKLKKVFNTAMCIHWSIAAIVLVLAETIGLWFVYYKLVIPVDRMTAALWVYQFSIFSTIVFIISVPYNACIIAHEKMSAFAIISIVEVVLKLLVVYLLLLTKYDKLIVYAILIFTVQLLIRVFYSIYCKCHFEESKYKLKLDKSLAKNMLGFTGWLLFGGLAGVGMGQGVNILLNLFFGPTVNAARAIASQVDNAVKGFVSNFQVALNPQIIKNYASKQMEQMHRLIFASSRYSYFLLFFLSLPVFLEADFILSIWLVEVPEHTVNFLRITMLVLLVNSLANPLITSANATGNIKKYQIVVGTILLLIVPVAYIALKLGCNAEFVFWIYLLIAIVAQTARICMIRPMIGLSIRRYATEVVLKIIFVTIPSIILPCLCVLSLESGWLRFFLTTFISFLSTLTFVYIIGIGSEERKIVKAKLRMAFKRINRK